MTTPMHISRRSLFGLAGASASAMLLAACGSNTPSAPKTDGPQTINWWTIQTGDPLKPIWQQIADDYTKLHSNVKIVITPLENEAFKSKLTTVTQSGNPPDLFQSWGGGVLKQQIDASLVKDLTADTSSWIGNLTAAAVQPYSFDGKVYGIPWDVGMVGFWYNKDHFATAGITDIPATWADFLAAVGKLKAKGITPIGLAGADKWPGHFYWAYLAIRTAGLDALKQAAVDNDFSHPDFVTAGQHLKELVDMQPFQKGFLAAKYDTPDGQAAAVGNGTAALELMGQWAPSTEESASASKKGLGDKLGFFTFPAVDGGKGKATDAFGGGNGFAIGKNAPPATVDFLKFILSVDNQRKGAAVGGLLPTAKGAEDALKDPNVKTVAATLAAATGFQLYLDQAYAPAVGAQVNDSVAELIAGKATPQQVADAITKTAKSQ